MVISDTQQICNILDVTRSWVNDHLRPLGTPKDRIKANTMIKYNHDDIVKFFNDNASFWDRDYPDIDPNANRRIAYERKRSDFPWTKIDYKIKSINQLITLKQYKQIKYEIKNKSDEMAHRELFLDRAKKCELFGRVWYII